MLSNISISHRIYGAFALVLFVTVTLAVSAFLTMQHLTDRTRQLLDTKILFSSAVYEVQAQVGALQRHEKDVILQIGGDPEALTSARRQWQGAMEAAYKGIEKARSTTASEQDVLAIDGLSARIGAYAAGFKRVMRSVDNGRVTTPIEASDKMAINKIATSEMEREMNAVAERAGASVKALSRELAGLQKRASLALGAVTGIAVVTVLLLAWGVSRSIVRPLAQAERAANEIASSGNLSLPIPNCGNNEIGRTVEAFSRMANAVKVMLNETREAAGQCTHLGGQVQHMSERVAQASAGQANDTAQISQSVLQLTSTIQMLSEHAEHVGNALNRNRQDAENGMELAGNMAEEVRQVATVIDQASQVIERLNMRSGQIGGIASVIRDIADQTNLLALNAAIEAAREVRKLAERTSRSTEEISGVIESVRVDTGAANAAMREAEYSMKAGIAHASQLQEALREMGGASKEAAEEMDALVNGIREQSDQGMQIASGVERIVQTGAENRQTSQVSLRVASELGTVAGTLEVVVGRFRI